MDVLMIWTDWRGKQHSKAYNRTYEAMADMECTFNSGSALYASVVVDGEIYCELEA